jgi:flagellar hook-associated protein 3 FlgL
MTPINSSLPGTAWFLNGLANLQQQESQTQRALSSGYQINDASDSPSQTPQLIQLGSSLAAVQAYQTNLGNVQAEATTADQAIGSGISLIQSAESLATQGASTASTAATRQTIATQIQSILQQVVSISNTSVQGRYIFGGNQDQSPPYQYDASSPTGVDALTTQNAARVIVNTQGQTVYQGLTAQQIFGPVDTTGVPTADNTFAALQSLVSALQSNNQTGIAGGVTALQNVSTYLSQQQAYYGAAEQRLTSEQNTAANQATELQVEIGNIRNTNVAQAATDLTQESTDQTAALGAEAELANSKTLFSYLG